MCLGMYKNQLTLLSILTNPLFTKKVVSGVGIDIPTFRKKGCEKL